MKKREKKRKVVREGMCRPVCKGPFCWVPRILAILFIVFISLFALDVFEAADDAGEIFLALIIHLIPSIVLIVFLIVSWRCEKIGGALFVVAGVIFTVFFDTYKDMITFLLISVPVFLIGILFWISGMRKVKN